MSQAIDIGLAIIGAMTSVIFWRISNDLRDMSGSVRELNIRVAVILERLETHEHRITRLEGKEE
jgi:hypothetical protein